MIQKKSSKSKPCPIPKLSTYHKTILQYLYRFRFLNRYHFQTIFNHKHHHRINLWLSYLVENKYIARIYSKTFGENTKPSIYYLLSKSNDLLRDDEHINSSILRRTYKEKMKSPKFIEHSLKVADLYCSYLKHSRDSNTVLHFYTKTDLLDHPYFIQPLPDAYLSMSDKDNHIIRYVFEVIDDHTPHFIIRNRFKAYQDYFDENTWQDETGYDFPIVMFVCSDESLKRFINRQITRLDNDGFDEITFSVL